MNPAPSPVAPVLPEHERSDLQATAQDLGRWQGRMEATTDEHDRRIGQVEKMLADISAELPRLGSIEMMVKNIQETLPGFNTRLSANESWIVAADSGTRVTDKKQRISNERL